MKLTAIATALITGMAMPALAQDASLGIWKTTPDDNGNYGYVEIAPCGEKICGVLVRAFNGSGTEIPSDNIGKPIVWDMQPQGNGAYAKGKIWSPDRDKIYSSKMQMTGDSMAVSGCVLGICRDGGTWTRVN